MPKHTALVTVGSPQDVAWLGRFFRKVWTEIGGSLHPEVVTSIASSNLVSIVFACLPAACNLKQSEPGCSFMLTCSAAPHPPARCGHRIAKFVLAESPSTSVEPGASGSQHAFRGRHSGAFGLPSSDVPCLILSRSKATSFLRSR